MLYLFLAIQQYLLSKLPTVSYIRLWNNNLEELEAGKDEQYQLPALFIEFPDEIRWEQLGNGNQAVDPLEVRIHIIHDFYDAQDGTMSQNLAVLALAQQVYKAFQDWMPSTMTIGNTGEYAAYTGTYPVPVGVMERTGEAQDKRHSNVYHFIQSYSTSWIDSDMGRPVGGGLSVPPLNYELDEVAPWQTGNLYTVGQYVSYTDDNVYQCILNTTIAYEVPTNATYWSVIK